MSNADFVILDSSSEEVVGEAGPRLNDSNVYSVPHSPDPNKEPSVTGTQAW